MRFEDNVGTVYNISKRSGGWQIVAKDKGGEPVPMMAKIYHLHREAIVQLRSFANTFHWKEMEDS